MKSGRFPERREIEETPDSPALRSLQLRSEAGHGCPPPATPASGAPRPNCPTCGADALYLYGHSRAGDQRFKCLLCGRQFVPHAPPALPAESRPPCPGCGASMHMYQYQNRFVRLRCSSYPACRTYLRVPRPERDNGTI